jgi:hypothetical protein
MNKNVSSPGPGQDGLNKFFARHLPDVAPPKNQQSLYQPEMPLYSDDTSGATTPGSMALNNGNINIENVGGAIESWMRRVASKAKDALEPAERAKVGRASVGTPRKGVRGVGDLIEMTDEFEIGTDEDGEGEGEAERGRRGSVVHSKLVDSGNGGGSSSSSAYPNSGSTTATATGAGRRERNKADYFAKGGKDD